MTSCEFCSVDESLPFTCTYCGKSFCVDHRLPEAHGCSELWRARRPRELAYGEGKKSDARRLNPSGWPQGWGYPYQGRRLLWFGGDELKHIVAGVGLVLLVGLSLIRWSGPVWFLGLMSLVFIAAFLVHELAHKFVAQRNGLWAEFRVQTLGAILTLVSVVSPFKIIAPGAVVIAGATEKSVMGRIALAGPLTNLAMASILYAASQVSPHNLSWALLSGTYLNLFIAVFNLIPFGIMDGQKVRAWSLKAWAVIFAVSLVALAYIGLTQGFF